MSATSSAVASVSSQLNQKKSGNPVRAGGRPALTLWAFTTMPDCCACLKIFVSRTTGSACDPIMSLSTSPAPTEGSWSTSPTSSRCAPGATALTSLFARITSTIDVSSITTRSASSGLAASNSGSPPGCSFSSRWMVAASWPVSSARRLAARPVGAARTILAFRAFASSTTERTVKLFPQPGPPVRTATLPRQCQLHRLCLLRCEVSARPGLQPGEGLLPVHGLEGGQAIRAAERRWQRTDARDRSE